MPSRLNKLVVEEIKKDFDGMDTCVFVDFTGLDGRKAADLRRQIRTACGAGVTFTIMKTTLAKHAFREMGIQDESGALDKFMAGPTAVAFGADDPVVLARTLSEWGKKQKLVPFKGGLLAGQPVTPETVAALALIPPKAVLMGQVIGTIAAPLTGLLAVAQGPIRKLLGLVDALAKKNAESQSA